MLLRTACEKALSRKQSRWTATEQQGCGQGAGSGVRGGIWKLEEKAMVA